MKRIQYKIVPTIHETLGHAWALKENGIVLGTFLTRRLAETKKNQLEKKSKEFDLNEH